MNKRICFILFAALAAVAVRAADVDVLFLGYYVFADATWRAEMAERGIHFQPVLKADNMAGNPDLYPLEMLKKYHVVVASGPIGRRWGPSVLAKIPEGMVDRLLEYQKAGGALVWLPTGVERSLEEWNDAIGRRIGVEALPGYLTNETTKAIFNAGGGSVRGLAMHTLTDDILPHPATEGVRHLWINPRGEWSSEGAIAQRFGPGWQPLVRLCGKDLIGVKDDPEGGRMALWPLYSAFTWGNYGHVALGKVFMKDGDGTTPSDGMRLTENLFRWLAEPAEKRGFGGAHLNPPDRPEPPPPLDLSIPAVPETVGHNWSIGREWPGLLGARSGRGGGRGTVRQWAEAAKKAGLSWIAFVDDVAKHTPESYGALVKDCADASSADFLAVPGVGGLDRTGYYRYYVGSTYFPPKDSGFLDAEGRFALPHKLVGGAGWDVFGGLAYYGRMPYTAWYPWICSTASLFTYDARGRLVDEGVDKWLVENQWGTSYQGPVALVHMNEPSVVADRAKRCHRTIFRGNRLADAVLNGFRAGSHESAGNIYPSSGPEIVFWGPSNIGGVCPWSANSDVWKFALVARSPAGIVRVEIRDASSGRTIRDLRYDKVQEVRDFILRDVNDRQVSYALVVTDAAGGSAVYPFNNWYPSNRVWVMGDRLMGMWHWLELREDEPRTTNLSGGVIGITWNKTFDFVMGMPGSPAPEASLKVQGIDGGHVYAPSQHLEFRMDIDGMAPEAYSFVYHQVISGHDVTIQDRDAPYVRAPGEHFVFEGCVPRLDKPVVALPRIRAYGTRQRIRSGYYVMPYEVEVRFLRDVKLKSVYLNAGSFTVQKGDWNQWYLRTAADGEIKHETLPDDAPFCAKNDMRQGGYTYIGPNLGGSAAFLVNDAPGFTFTVNTSSSPARDASGMIGRANRIDLVFPEKGGRAFAKGETLRFGVMMANHMFAPGQESNAWLEKFVKDFGIGTGRPGFAYTLSKGVFRGCNWFFDVDAQKGAAKLAIPRNDLGQRLPVRVRGLSPQAIHGEYNNRTRRVRILPLVPDTGELVTTYDTAARATDVTLGDFVRWTNPAAVVTMMPEGLDFVVEAHNPTAKPITVRLAGNAAFAPFAHFRAELELRPHETRALKVGAPGGSVSDAVHY